MPGSASIPLTFVTGNAGKFQIAQAVFESLGLHLQQLELDVDEIQAEDGATVVQDKARRAFNQSNRPVVVNDDSWSIVGLNGFPGPYMKSMLRWLSADDLLRLTSTLQDRTIILQQFIAYKDPERENVILTEHRGTLLTESRGEHGNALQKIVTVPADGGLSIAEAYDRGAMFAGRPGGR